MSDGLITRIGKWWDSKFEDKATMEYVVGIENEIDKRFAGTEKRFNDIAANHYKLIQELQDVDRRITDKLATLPPAEITHALSKELADLKTRMEKMELYSGMTRKVDPTKPPVAKSAFSM